MKSLAGDISFSTFQCRRSQCLFWPQLLEGSLLIACRPIARRPFTLVLIPTPPHRLIPPDQLRDQNHSQTKKHHQRLGNISFRDLGVTLTRWRIGTKSTATKSNPPNRHHDPLEHRIALDRVRVGLLLLGHQHEDIPLLKDLHDTRRQAECIVCALRRHHHQAWIQKIFRAMAGVMLLHQLGMVEGYPPAMPRVRTPPLREDNTHLPLVLPKAH